MPDFGARADDAAFVNDGGGVCVVGLLVAGFGLLVSGCWLLVHYLSF